MEAARRNDRESNINNNSSRISNNSCLNFLRDSEQGSAKGGSREEF